MKTNGDSKSYHAGYIQLASALLSLRHYRLSLTTWVLNCQSAKLLILRAICFQLKYSLDSFPLLVHLLLVKVLFLDIFEILMGRQMAVLN